MRPTALLVACVFLLVAACDSPPQAPAPVALPQTAPADTAWYRTQLIDGNAKPRLQFAMADNGFYRPNLGRDWRPSGDQQATLISQSRAIYVMAAAYEVTGDTAYRDAMVKAADFLLERFAKPGETGVWVRAVAPDGRVVDPSYHALGQAEVIFALAHAYRSSKSKKYLDAALGTWLELDIPRLVSGQKPGVKLQSLNLAMHQFEGLLALYKSAPSKVLSADLKLLGDYVLARFFEPQRGFFYETLDDQLRPAADGAIRLGHNVEVAFLLSRAVDIGLPPSYLEAANRTVDFVVAHGINRADSSLPHELNYDGTVRDAARASWCQAELLRALAHFAKQRERTDLSATYDAALAYAKAHFVDREMGGWFDQADRPDLPKGSEWNVGYHVAMFLTEVLRLNGAKFQSGREMLL